MFSLTTGGQETLLHGFTGGIGPNKDGRGIGTAVIEASDGNYYGTTAAGGQYGYGTVYEVTAQGAYSVLYSFAGGPLDGATPSAVIQGSDGNFYGTSATGGTPNAGTVYQVTPAGVETVVHSFVGNTLNGGVNADGERPSGGLVEGTPGTFYGVTSYGGAFSSATKGDFGGTIFKVTSQGNESVLYSFGAFSKDGMTPSGTLVHATDGFFYGTTNLGGQFGYGMVFRIADPLP